MHPTSRLMKFWYRRNTLAWLLWPVSVVFCVLGFIRRFSYTSGMLKPVVFTTPVVIIGNISVGGSGKTPLLISICDYLTQQGRKPGVVSRGYGGRIKTVHALSSSDLAVDVGDEPLMIYQRTACPVVIGADRAAAVDYLLSSHDCDIVLADDGLQHYHLARTMEIAVVDAQIKHGNGFCLPAGPLREPVRRLQEVDLVIYNGIPDGTEWESKDKLFYQLDFSLIVNLLNAEQQPLSILKHQRVIAVAGIGQPSRFFRLLQQQGMDIEPRAYADHYVYTLEDINSWQGKTVIMTEKDAVKCRPLIQQQHTHAQFWYLPVKAHWSDALTRFMAWRLENLITGSE